MFGQPQPQSGNEATVGLETFVGICKFRTLPLRTDFGYKSRFVSVKVS
jgi:hypothetical protein